MTANTVVKKIPLNQFRNIFQRTTHQETKRSWTVSTEPAPVPRIPAPAPHIEAPELSNIIRGAFSSKRDARRYAKHLERKEKMEVPLQQDVSRNHRNDSEIHAAVR